MAAGVPVGTPLPPKKIWENIYEYSCGKKRTIQ